MLRWPIYYKLTPASMAKKRRTVSCQIRTAKRAFLPKHFSITFSLQTPITMRLSNTSALWLVARRCIPHYTLNLISNQFAFFLLLVYLYIQEFSPQFRFSYYKLNPVSWTDLLSQPNIKFYNETDYSIIKSILQGEHWL